MTTELTATIVFQKNWKAIHKKCETCGGSGMVNSRSCTWCGDGGKGSAGSGRHYKHIINRGSSRSSKTYSLIDCYDLYARQNANKRLTVWRDTKKDCKDTVLKDALKHLKITGRYKQGQEFNKTDSVFTYTTESTFEIHGTDDEEKVHGLTQDAAWLNEPYKISRATFDQIDQRTSDFIFIDYNPKAGHWVEDLMKDPRAIVIDSTFKDNPFCPPEQRRKILSYQPVKWSAVCIARRDAILAESRASEKPAGGAPKMTEQGAWDQAEKEAQAYNTDANPAGYERRHVRELERCQHNEAKNSANEYNWLVYGLGMKAERKGLVYKNWKEVPQLPEDYDWQVCGIDFGFSNDPTAVVLVRKNGNALYFDELVYKTELTNRDLLRALKTYGALLPDNMLYWCDHDANRIADLRQGFRSEGLRGISAVAAVKGPDSIIAGIAKLHEYQCFYTARSKNIKMELDNYEYKEEKGRLLEVPIDNFNHALDACRYAAYTQTMRVRK